jgi:hypothetical protein
MIVVPELRGDEHFLPLDFSTLLADPQHISSE